MKDSISSFAAHAPRHMTQPLPAAFPNNDAPLNLTTARIVVVLNNAISAFRAGRGTGLRSLDSSIGLMSELTDEQVMSEAERRAELKRIVRCPDRVELAILKALADTYGYGILHNASLGYALRLIARHGGVALLQRILWGESASDAQLATMLAAARTPFIQIVFAFRYDLLAEANDLLSRFRRRPPGEENLKPGLPA